MTTRLAIWVALLAMGHARGEVSLRWVRDASAGSAVSVEVTGVDASALNALRDGPWPAEDWPRLLTVRVERGDLFTDVGLPPMLGDYRVETKLLRFVPRFPLEHGVVYRATFWPSRLPGGAARTNREITATFQLPARKAEATTVVQHVFPSAGTLPENLLKFYVHFSAPMSRGHSYDHIHLRNDAGKDIELPFLEIDEELWDTAMRRLTLFIDPGRIKRGVRPLEEVGPALEDGHRYTLEIDRGWRDAMGQPLKESFRKSFRVGPPVRTPIDPQTWTIRSPAAGTRDALTVSFPRPLDHALARRVIRVVRIAGERVVGSPSLEDEERQWNFVPQQPWAPGPHELRIESTLEDLAGNNIDKPFEVDLFDAVQPGLTNATVRVPFEIR